jgi:hypothetical protein
MDRDPIRGCERWTGSRSFSSCFSSSCP